MRRVEYYERKLVTVCPTKFKKELIGEAYFLTWGTDCEEYENGVGNYTTAIIELDDGTVKSVYCENIKFIDREKK